MLQRLDNENIRVPESLRYYPYRATLDFGYYFDAMYLPSESDKVHWVARHVPLSVTVASNWPEHKQLQCLVGDPDKLVADMIDILRAMSDAPYEDLNDAYGHVLEEQAETKIDWDEREHAARLLVDDDNDAE